MINNMGERKTYSTHHYSWKIGIITLFILTLSFAGYWSRNMFSIPPQHQQGMALLKHYDSLRTFLDPSKDITVRFVNNSQDKDYQSSLPHRIDFKVGESSHMQLWALLNCTCHLADDVHRGLSDRLDNVFFEFLQDNQVFFRVHTGGFLSLPTDDGGFVKYVCMLDIGKRYHLFDDLVKLFQK
jgi:hypothetical protein